MRTARQCYGCSIKITNDRTKKRKAKALLEAKAPEVDDDDDRTDTDDDNPPAPKRIRLDPSQIPERTLSTASSTGVDADSGGGTAMSDVVPGDVKNDPKTGSKVEEDKSEDPFQKKQLKMKKQMIQRAKSRHKNGSRFLSPCFCLTFSCSQMASP